MVDKKKMYSQGKKPVPFKAKPVTAAAPKPKPKPKPKPIAECSTCTHYKLYNTQYPGLRCHSNPQRLPLREPTHTCDSHVFK